METSAILRVVALAYQGKLYQQNEGTLSGMRILIPFSEALNRRFFHASLYSVILEIWPLMSSQSPYLFTTGNGSKAAAVWTGSISIDATEV